MKISVVIITRNRLEDVLRSLEGYKRQNYKNYEIVIIDNASNDGTKEYFKNNPSDVKYLWLPNNFDIRSINIGIELSDGDLIWRTDDDSFPESENAFQMAVDIMQKNNDIHVICTEDVEVRQGYIVWEWYPFKVDKVNVPEKGYQANIFAGTGAVIRREVINKVGGFWEFGFEELEFSTKAILAGFNLRYFPQIRTLHFASPSERIMGPRWIKMTKQLIRYHWKYFPFLRALGISIIILLNQVFIAIIRGLSPLIILEGIFGAIEISFFARREEKNIIPKEKMYDVTLGQNIVKKILRENLIIFKRNFKKIFKTKN